MGQYYHIVNIDKKQYLHPNKFNDGMKLMEFGCSACGTLTGLAALLADGNGRGGGDLITENPIVGTWAGDRIVIAGDYSDPDRFLPTSTPDQPKRNLFGKAFEDFEDVSEQVAKAILDDSYVKNVWKKNTSR